MTVVGRVMSKAQKLQSLMAGGSGRHESCITYSCTGPHMVQLYSRYIQQYPAGSNIPHDSRVLNCIACESGNGNGPCKILLLS